MDRRPRKRDPRSEARKPYSTPKLFIHGDAAALTRSLLRLGWLGQKRFPDFSVPP